MFDCKTWLTVDKMEEVIEFSVSVWEHGERSEEESSQRQRVRICTAESFERKKCEHGGKENYKEHSIALTILSRA